MAEKKDYYDVLGVGKGASDDEIKKAFRRKAVELHPDKGGDEAKFKELNEAYEVLKDSSKRQRYNQFGHAGVGGNSGYGGGNPFEGFQGFGGQGQSANFDFGDMGFGDIFSNFFGGGSSSKQQERGHDVEARVEISFEEAVFGTEVDLKLNLDDICEHCKGSGAEPGYELKTCDQCKGSGEITKVMRTVLGNIQQRAVCSKCRGRGKIPEKECSVCHGGGTQRKAKDITFKVPAGIDDGATIRLRDQGEATSGGQRGDLYVQVRVKAHKLFTREGDLILSEQHISMVDAALGTDIKVDTVDGPITMKIPAGTQSGSDFKLSGHGVTHVRGSGRGAHIVTIIVDTPTKLSKKQQELLEQFGNNPKKGWF